MVPTLPRVSLPGVARVLTSCPVKPHFDTGWSHLTKPGTHTALDLHWVSVVMDKKRNPVTHLIFMGRPQALSCRIKYVLENLEQETNISGDIQQNEMGGE